MPVAHHEFATHVTVSVQDVSVHDTQRGFSKDDIFLPFVRKNTARSKDARECVRKSQKEEESWKKKKTC